MYYIYRPCIEMVDKVLAVKMWQYGGRLCAYEIIRKQVQDKVSEGKRKSWDQF